MQLRVLLLIMICCSIKAVSQDTSKIKLEDIEINFLSSYYQQDGNHSPVTGGIGTEKLQNIAPSMNISIPVDSATKWNIDGGIDFYSSASSDNINNPYLSPNHVSGASSKDERSYVTVKYSKKKRNHEVSYLVGTSFEWDVFSYSAGIGYQLDSKDKNQSVNMHFKYFLDDWKLIYPTELRNGNLQYLATDIRHTANFSASFSKNLSRKISTSIATEIVMQTGLLSTPFHRVYFADKVRPVIEMLPSSRVKYPVSARLNMHLTDFLILKSFVRYYQDSWNLKGTTMELTLPIKISQAVRAYPFYRFHSQQAADYFAPKFGHVSTQEFYTSDYDLSTFTSTQYGLGISITPLFGFTRMKYAGSKVAMLKTLSFRFGTYSRSDGLSAYIGTFGAQINLKR